MRVLGIETSCDETAAAVVAADAPGAGGDVLSDVVRSQLDVHAPYGGVVPELASRDHMRSIALVVDQALAGAGARLGDLDGVAVTCRPGLAGALLVGVQFARGLAWARDLPFVGVDHLVGHILAVFLRRDGAPAPAAPSPAPAKPAYPFVALVASGGHTAIYRVDGPLPTRVRELGATRDDAAGEAFDKVAKLLGLGYPGGPVVDRLAARGNPEAVRLPRPMGQNTSLEFSFSGLKTAVMRRVQSHGLPASDEALADLCASFQRRVVDALVTKTVAAATREAVRDVVVAGGVAANRELRERARAACAAAGLELHVPPVASCTDNAAMIAYAGAERLLAGERDGWDLATATRTALERVTRRGRGRR